MNTLSDPIWQRLLPKLRARCPRLTDQDLQEAQQRVDLLTAKIQNRHWVSKTVAGRTLAALISEVGAAPAT